MKKIVVIMPRGDERHDVYSILRDIAKECGEQIKEQVDVVLIQKLLIDVNDVQVHLTSADVVIADISRSRPDVMYELGLTHGLKKPTVLISEEISQPRFSDISKYYRVLYDRSNIDKSFRKKLFTQVVEALQHPEHKASPKFGQGKQTHRLPSVFISYSHADSESLERLRVHLKPIKRNNDIEFFDDAQIEAGSRWEQDIKDALERATIAILMISADYLASDYIVKNELPPLLKAAEDRGTKIIPIILKPCGFRKDNNLSVFQAINDPEKPLLTLPEVQQEAIYERIADRIENELKSIK